MDEELHDSDFYSWTKQQVRLLKDGRISEVDMDNLIEEIEDLGSNKRDAVESHLINLLHHLLKWQYQSERRDSSWERSIKESRRRIEYILERNPGIQSKLSSIYGAAWKYGRKYALDDTGNKCIPLQNPWSYEQVIDPDFFPSN